MYNFYSDSEDLIKNTVTAEDVLKIYRFINNINLCNDDIVLMENKLLINSFSKNHFLYSNKFLYYKISMMLTDICLLNDDTKYIENKYNILLNDFKFIIENSLNNASDFKEKLENKLIEEVYINLIDNSLSSSKDITRVHKCLNNNNDTTAEVIKLENNLFINKFYRNKIIFSNKFIYLKMVSIIKNIGLNTNNVNLINDTFETMINFTKSILCNKNIDNLNKFKIINLLYFEYMLLSGEEMTEYENKLISLNQSINNIEEENKFTSKTSDNKVLTYTLNKACVL